MFVKLPASLINQGLQVSLSLNVDWIGISTVSVSILKFSTQQSDSFLYFWAGLSWYSKRNNNFVNKRRVHLCPYTFSASNTPTRRRTPTQDEAYKSVGYFEAGSDPARAHLPVIRRELKSVSWILAPGFFFGIKRNCPKLTFCLCQFNWAVISEWLIVRFWNIFACCWGKGITLGIHYQCLEERLAESPYSPGTCYLCYGGNEL